MEWRPHLYRHDPDGRSTIAWIWSRPTKRLSWSRTNEACTGAKCRFIAGLGSNSDSAWYRHILACLSLLRARCAHRVDEYRNGHGGRRHRHVSAPEQRAATARIPKAVNLSNQE